MLTSWDIIVDKVHRSIRDAGGVVSRKEAESVALACVSALEDNGYLSSSCIDISSETLNP